MAILTGWEASLEAGIPGSVSDDIRWNFARALVISLKAFSTAPWVTRGSSASGTLGDFFSATPDGVDYWNNSSRTEVANSGALVWHVLENTITGAQICIALRANGGSSQFELTVAQNKFETGGAWRSVVDEADRPADTTSSPASDREVNTNTTSFPSPQSPGVDSYLSVVMNRTDGKGFYVYFYDNDPTKNEVFVAGAFQITHLQPTRTNLWMAMCGRGGSFLDSALLDSNGGTGFGTAGSIASRIQDGTRKLNSSLELGVSGSPMPLTFSDPWGNGLPLFPIVFWNGTSGPTPVSAQGSPPDMLMTGGSTTHLDTWNGGAYIQLQRVLFPWRGIVKNSDQTGYILFADPVLPVPVASGTTDRKRFASGMEIL